VNLDGLGYCFHPEPNKKPCLCVAFAIPNELTSSTLEKSRRGEDIQEFDSIEALFKNWEK